MNNAICIIVVPVYKSSPSRSELASFNQLLKILGNHKICIITHKELDVSTYLQQAGQRNITIQFEYFDKSYFEGVKGYNKLCLSKDFYARFCAFEYMPIYQLDAWVFSDQLNMWCEKGYDYIGAPYSMWMKGSLYGFSYHWLGTRNGGFSLRKISYCLKLTSLKHRYIPYITPKGFLIREWKFIRYHNNPVWKKIIKFFYHIILQSLGFRNNRGYYLDGNVNEDYFFSCDAEHAWGVTCNLPDWKESARFSFEYHQEYLYHAIGDKLPFGCHAFEKYGDFYTKNNFINY